MRDRLYEARSGSSRHGGLLERGGGPPADGSMQGMAQMTAWLGVALGAVYVIFAGGGWWGIYSPALRVITMTLAVVALVTWSLVAWRRPSWRARSALLPAILAVLASLAISTVFSRNSRVSAEYLGYAVILG